MSTMRFTISLYLGDGALLQRGRSFLQQLVRTVTATTP